MTLCAFDWWWTLTSNLALISFLAMGSVFLILLLKQVTSLALAMRKAFSIRHLTHLPTYCHWHKCSQLKVFYHLAYFLSPFSNIVYFPTIHFQCFLSTRLWLSGEASTLNGIGRERRRNIKPCRLCIRRLREWYRRINIVRHLLLNKCWTMWCLVEWFTENMIIENCLIFSFLAFLQQVEHYCAE